jgi:hypothetical protein
MALHKKGVRFSSCVFDSQSDRLRRLKIKLRL